MSEPLSEIHIPYKKIIGYLGVAMILAGYLFLAIDPDAQPAIAIVRAFIGMGLVITGAILSLGAFLFVK